MRANQNKAEIVALLVGVFFVMLVYVGAKKFTQHLYVEIQQEASE